MMFNQQEQEKLSPEEIKKRQDQTMQYYKEQLPYLEQTLKYEEMITYIEEYRTRQVAAQAKRVELMMKYSEPKKGPEDKDKPSAPDA